MRTPNTLPPKQTFQTNTLHFSYFSKFHAFSSLNSIVLPTQLSKLTVEEVRKRRKSMKRRTVKISASEVMSKRSAASAINLESSSTASLLVSADKVPPQDSSSVTFLLQQKLSSPISNLGIVNQTISVSDENRFDDIDGTSISLLSQSPGHKVYSIKSADKVFLNIPLEVHYFYRSVKEKELTEVISLMLENQPPSSDPIIIGIDTESGKTRDRIELLQLSSASMTLLIHRNSGLFNSNALRQLLDNTVPGYMHRLIFTGAEIVGDALALMNINGDYSNPLRVHGLLDLTPVYSNWANGFVRGTALSSHHFIKVVAPEIIELVGLRRMFFISHNIDWNKDKAITLSNWSIADLSLAQIKYASLDAFVSYRCGDYLASEQMDCVVDSLFTMRHILSYRKLSTLYNECKGLSDMGKRQPRAILVANLTLSKNGKKRFVDVYCNHYANALRERFSKILIKVISPGGSKDGIEVRGLVSVTKGKVSSVEMFNLSGSDPPLNQADATTWRALKIDVAAAVVKFWKQEDEITGSYSNLFHSDSKVVKVRFFLEPSSDIPLQQVSEMIKHIVHSHTVVRGVNPPSICSSFLFKLLCNELNSHSDIVLSEETQQSVLSHQKHLTSQQFGALYNSFASKVSVIQGPPGTGKTRVIAAIADVAADVGRTVLIIAPGNAASRRILESILNTGFEDVCLIVAEHYFLEFHQESYEDSISKFVFTKEKLDGKNSQRQRSSGNVASSDHRAQHDFRDRKYVKHVSKYDPISKPSEIPSVTIATNGCIASALFHGNAKWGRQVKMLVDFSKVDMLIIDESSQLWDGYMMGWALSSLPKLKNFVIVGDEKQLPPYGEDDILGLTSLLSTALKDSNVPRQLLDISWRLPTVIGKFISDNVYDGELNSHRSVSADRIFRSAISIYKSSNSVPMQLLRREIHSPTGNGGLAWIHHVSKAHTNKETNSTGNEEESKLACTLIAEYIKLFEAIRLTGDKIFHVKLLTPYLEQKAILEKRLVGLLVGYKNMDLAQTVDYVQSSLIVNTVDSFQGQEAEIVIVSLARSDCEGSSANGLGFAKDSRRANVMLSRAQQLMIVVGDAENMVRHSSGRELIPALARYASDVQSLFVISLSQSSRLDLYTIQSSVASTSLFPKLKALKKKAPDVTMTLKSKQRASLDHNTTEFYSKVHKVLQENHGVIMLNHLKAKIPKSERPPGARTLLRPLKDDPEVYVAAIENNEYVVLSANVINQASKHFKLLLNNTSNGLPLELLKEKTSYKDLGLRNKDLVSVDCIVSCLSDKHFTVKDNSLFLKLPLSEEKERYFNQIKLYLSRSAGVYIIIDKLCKQVPIMTQNLKSIKYLKLIKECPELSFERRGTTIYVALPLNESQQSKKVSEHVLQTNLQIVASKGSELHEYLAVIKTFLRENPKGVHYICDLANRFPRPSNLKSVRMIKILSNASEISVDYKILTNPSVRLM